MNDSQRNSLAYVKALVGGFPRSGTTWIYKVLHRVGYSIRHEYPFGPTGYGGKDTCMDNMPRTCVTGFIHPYIDQVSQWKKEGGKVYWVVRNPVDVVNSCIGAFPACFTNLAADAIELSRIWL